jgi:hypothetical protein
MPLTIPDTPLQPSDHLVYAAFGQGRRLAVVMSPVMPLWDHGGFFAPMTARLVALGYRVLVFDSLSLPHAEVRLADFAAAWEAILRTLGPIQLLAGVALGGALVQCLLARPWAAQVPATWLISAPTRADALLEARLAHLAHLARAGRLRPALQALAAWVAAAPATPPAWTTEQVLASTPAGQHLPDPPGADALHPCSPACSRLWHGFGLLHAFDLSHGVDSYPGRLISLYGGRSQLVRAANVTFAITLRHVAVAIADSGMRPHLEQPAQAWAQAQAHLQLTSRELP